jgi:glutamate 5-kinase
VVTEYRRIVVKLGTSVLTDGTDWLSRPRMVDLVRQMAELRLREVEVILVSSGAVFAGREALGFPKVGRHIPLKQVLAAVGQVRLMHLYQQLFELYDVTVAQALLTRADLIDRVRYLNARNTLLALLERGIIPVVNENDVVAVEEIKIGDNDNLSALVANLVDADLLIMLTDTAGLFTADPRRFPGARLISEVSVIDDGIRTLAGTTNTRRGTGGMVTKVQAAELAMQAGTAVIIAAGDESDVILRLAAGATIGTRFIPTVSHVESRKRWILAEPVRGELRIDQGAVEAVHKQGKSLLPVGVTAVGGEFERGETVRICDSASREIARGIANYAAADLTLIKGRRSADIETILGYAYGEEVVHRNDLVVLQA